MRYMVNRFLNLFNSISPYKIEKYANVLKQLQAVGVGFVDGDIELLYQGE